MHPTDPQNSTATTDDIDKLSKASKGLVGGSSAHSAADCQGMFFLYYELLD